jgi:capsular polysaccharide export protein
MIGEGDRVAGGPPPRLVARRVALGAKSLAALFPGVAIVRRVPRDSGVPYVTLGEGVLRGMPRDRGRAACVSVTAAVIGGPPSSLDRLDAGRVLASRNWETSQLLAHAAAARRDLVAATAGGAWWEGDYPDLPREPYVLAAVDTDDEVAAAAMLAAVGAVQSRRPLVVLGPFLSDHLGRMKSLVEGARVRNAVVVASCDPWAALAGAERVYSLGGEIGFLGLLADRPVSCFGPAFYAGWGVTDDAAGVPPRPFSRGIDEIFAGACLVATRYIDPFRQATATFDEALAIVADWRAQERTNRSIAVCVGMQFWKRRRVADFLRSGAGVPAFRRSISGALAAARRRPGGAIATWPSRMPEGLDTAAAAAGIPLVRVEDGFVRSFGLGSDFLPPASVVLDRRGMYFDPRVTSDLEILLREAAFDEPLLDRARLVADQLVHRGITKYNLGKRAEAVGWPVGRRRILVPGQVEDDLSVMLGGGGVRGNLELLRRVREAEKDAFIVYKPHPDVLAGHRKGAVPEHDVRQIADAIVIGAATAALLGEIDELHTLTSLAGFEALLRRRRVVVYGRPFYAGWGLTDDRLVIDRGRKLTLEELVAGTLILYPRYLDPVTRLPCGPEVIIERLDHPELWRVGPLVWARRLQGAAVRRFADRFSRAPALVGARQKGRE